MATKRALGARWFQMEYECEFGDDIASVFATADIARAVSGEVAPLFGRTTPRSAAGDPAVKPLFASEGPPCSR